MKFIPPEDGLGERILMLRTQKGLTHEGVSALTKLADPVGVGISRTTIRGYELGNFKPGARELRILAKALQVPLDWLLLGEAVHQVELTNGERSADATYAEVTQLSIAFTALPEPERNAIKTLAFSLLKYKVGEVDYRKLMGFSGDLANVVVDASKEADGDFSKGIITKVTQAISDYWPEDTSKNKK